MSYQRMRTRNNLMFRKPDDDPDPYWRTLEQLKKLGPNADLAYRPDFGGLIGDMNRMERDYLSPQYPQPPFASREAGSDPVTQCSAATGVDEETIRKVLRYVFLEQP